MTGTYTRSIRIHETGTRIKTSTVYYRIPLILLLSNGDGLSIECVSGPDFYIVIFINSLNGIEVHYEIYQIRREFLRKGGGNFFYI